MDWFRYYTETLDNRKIQALAPAVFKRWVNFMCLNRLYGGTLPDVDTIAFRLRCTPKQAGEWRAELMSLKLIDAVDAQRFTMHDWDEHQYDSDSSTERSRKYRSKRSRNGQCNVSGNVPVTVQNRTDTDTETEQNRTDWRERFETWVTELQNCHPKKAGNGESGRLLMEYLEASLHPEREMDLITARHDEWCEYWDQNGFTPKLDNWVRDKGWLDSPPKPKKQTVTQSFNALLAEVAAKESKPQ